MTTHRRRFLRLCGVAGVVAIAGCSSDPDDGGATSTDSGVQDSDGDGVIDSEDYAPRDPSVQEQSDIQTPADGTPTQTSVTTETPTPTENTDVEEDALQEYEAGKNDAESARSYGNTASSQANDENYDNARRQFNNVIDSSNDAIAHFNTAADLADQAGHPEARDMADDAAEFMNEIWIEWAELGLDAVDELSAGRDDDAEVYLEDMEDIVDRSESDSGPSVAEAIEFRDALGL